MDERQHHNTDGKGEDRYRNDMADQLFDSVLKRACEELAKEEYEQDKKGSEKIELPKELDDRIFTMLAEAKAKEGKEKSRARKETRKVHSVTVLRKAAMIFLCIAVLGAIAIPNGDAWRVRFQNLFLGMTDTSTELKFKLDDTNDIVASELPSPEYVPKGYNMTESGSEGGRAYIVFQNNANESLVFEISETEVTHFNSHTTEIYPIDINDMEGFYSTKEGTNILIWERDEYAYSLSGTISKEEIIRMAKSVEY